MDMNPEQFAQILDEIKYTARMAGGYIEESQIREAFGENELTSEQLLLIEGFLKESNIGIGQPLPDTEVLSSSEIDILEEYRNELSLIEPIGDGQKRALIMAAMNNDREAQKNLAGYYLPKVLEISKLYSGQGALLEDLIGEGNLAVMEGVSMLGAMESPDEADGMIAKLIMDSMEELISESFKTNEADEKIAAKVNKVSEEAHKLALEIGRAVTVEEMVENTSLSKKAVMEAIELSANKIEDIEFEDTNETN